MQRLTTYSVRQSDAPGALPVQIVDADNGNAPYPLAGLTVTAKLYPVAYFGQAHSATPIINNRPCTITDLTTSTVAMPWQGMATPGRYELDLLIWQGSTHVATVKGLQVTVMPES